MNEHIDTLQTTEGFDHRKWKVIQIVRIKKSEMQSMRIQTLDNLTGSSLGCADISNRHSTSGTKSGFGGATTFFGNIGNVDFRKRRIAFTSALESDERAPINFLLRIANNGATGPAKEVDVSRATRALNPFSPSCAGNIDVLTKPLVLLFCPRPDFVERQTIIVQHVHTLRDKF